MEAIKGLKIANKQGPFYLRKLTLAELAAWDGTKGDSNEKMLALVQATLVTKDGKPVFTDKQLPKMERDLGAVRVLSLAHQAQEVNEFHLMADMRGAVEAAEKN